MILSGTLAPTELNQPNWFSIVRDPVGNWTVTINGVPYGPVLDNQLTFGLLAWMEIPQGSLVVRADRRATKAWFRRT